MVTAFNLRYDHLHRTRCKHCGSMLAFELSDADCLPALDGGVYNHPSEPVYIIECPHCRYKLMIYERDIKQPGDINESESVNYYTGNGELVGTSYGKNPICFTKTYSENGEPACKRYGSDHILGRR